MRLASCSQARSLPGACRQYLRKGPRASIHKAKRAPRFPVEPSCWGLFSMPPLPRAWPHRTSSTVATGVILAAATRSSLDDARLKVFRSAGVVRVFILARLVVIHRFYSERVVISAEVGVNGCRPFPLHTYPRRIRSKDAAPSNIVKYARNSHRDQVRKRGKEGIPRKSGYGDAGHWHSANKRGRSRARRGIEDDGCVWY